MVSHSTSTLCRTSRHTANAAGNGHFVARAWRAVCYVQRARAVPDRGLEPDAMRQLDQIVSSRTRVRKRDKLYRPGDQLHRALCHSLGTFKTILLAEDGREQITGYHMAGEIVGLDGIGDDRHACQAVALEDSEVCVLPFKRLDELAHDVPPLRRNLYRLISKESVATRT